jgi:hypothetical protein
LKDKDIFDTIKPAFALKKKQDMKPEGKKEGKEEKEGKKKSKNGEETGEADTESTTKVDKKKDDGEDDLADILLLEQKKFYTKKILSQDYEVVFIDDKNKIKIHFGHTDISYHEIVKIYQIFHENPQFNSVDIN